MLLITAGIGATPALAMLHALARRTLRARDLVAARRTQQPRPRLRRRGARAPRLAPERPQPRLLQPPGPRRSRGPRLRQRRPSHPVAARRARAAARCRGLPLRAAPVHGRDQRRSGGAGASTAHASTPSPSGLHRARRRASRQHLRGHRTRPPVDPETARRSSSPAATSPSAGATTTRACSSSPRPATCPSAGRAAPASATAARPP